jgi:hypothetical protein
MQLGSLLRSSRRLGPDIWEFRYRDRRHNGRRTYRRIKIGTAYVLQYQSMLVFTHVLHERRYLGNDLWTILRAEHQRTGADPLFEREWKLVKKQFEMYPNFIAYVDSLLPARRPGTQ